MQIAISTEFKGKADDLSKYNRAFRNYTYDPARLFRGVRLGYPFLCCSLKEDFANREIANFKEAILVCVDIDNAIKKDTRVSDKEYIRYEDIESDKFVSENALFIYETATSKPEWNRIRIVFQLPETVTNVNDFKNYCIPLVKAYGGDSAPTNPVSVFYGSENGKAKYIGKVLTRDAFNKLAVTQQAVQKQNIQQPNSLPSVEEVREMLSYIPRSMEYMNWMRVVSAVANHYPLDAERLIREWSDGKDGEVAYKIRHRLDGVGIGTLIHLAKMHGCPFKPKIVKPAPQIISIPDGEEWLISGDQLDRTPVNWILDDFFARGCTTMLYGRKASGKSLFAQLMFRLQTEDAGINWSEKGVNCLYIKDKDASENMLGRREELVPERHKIFYNKSDLKIDLMEETTVTAFIDLCKKTQKTKIDCIVFDTVSKFHTGGSIDENAVDKWTSELKRIAIALNCAVIGIGHSNKNSPELQGSEKVGGGFDIMWHYQQGKNKVFLLSRTKDREMVNENLDEVKLKFVAGYGFIPTNEPFEPKNTMSGFDFHGRLAEMPNEFTDNDFSKATGLPLLKITPFLRSMTKNGTLIWNGKNRYTKRKEQQAEVEARFGDVKTIPPNTEDAPF